MSDYNILIHPEFFGSEYKNDPSLVICPILATFLDREGRQWFAFEVAELEGAFIIAAASRFYIALGTEEELCAKERTIHEALET